MGGLNTGPNAAGVMPVGDFGPSGGPTNGPLLPGGLAALFGIGGGGGSAQSQLAAAGVNGPASLNPAQSDEDRALLQKYLSVVMGALTGTGPSAAQAQLSAGLRQAIAAQQATSAGTGPNAALRQRGVAQRAATLEGEAANQAAAIRGSEAQAAGTQLGGTASALHAADIGAATANAGFQNSYNQQIGALNAQEEAQRNAFNQQLAGALTGAAGDALHVAAMASGGMTYLGERGPEVVAHAHGGGEAKLVDHPMLAHLPAGRVVVPLAKGSAPYRGGPLPDAPTGAPTKAAPKRVVVSPKAVAALTGRHGPAAPQPGIAPLSPKLAPTVIHALLAAGVHPVFPVASARR